jgi:hypothetical protein
VSGLFVAKAKGKDPSLASLVCAAVYVISAGWMFFVGFKNSVTLLGWVAAVALLGLGAFGMTRVAQRRKTA